MAVDNPKESGLYLDRPVRRDVFTRPPDWREDPKHLSIVELKLARTRLGVTSFPGPVRGVVVGEVPGAHTHEDLPMFPSPVTSSAGRLMEMSKLTPAQYLGCLYRRNVCYRRWSEGEASNTARLIVSSLFDHKDLFVVMCGHKVAAAFGVPCSYWMLGRLESRNCYTVIPHPSGLNRVYNDPGARERTRLWMRFAALEETP